LIVGSGFAGTTTPATCSVYVVPRKNPKTGNRQTTPQGLEIPVPKRGDFDALVRKVAGPGLSPKDSRVELEVPDAASRETILGIVRSVRLAGGGTVVFPAGEFPVSLEDLLDAADGAS
jgi:hypothetical protein